MYMNVCAKKGPAIEGSRGGDGEVESSYMAICQFTTILKLSVNNIHISPRKSAKTTFWRLNFVCWCALG